MKNWKLKPLSLVLNISVLMVLFITVFGLSPQISLAAAIPSGVITGTCLSMLPNAQLRMGLQTEIWAKTIQEKLREDNTFLNAFSDVSDQYIINGKIVHIPQAGEPSKVVKNRQTLPADVKQRTDGEVLYKIDEYTTDPVHIAHADTLELSYDKRMSVLNQDIANLSDEVAEGMLTNMVKSPQDSGNLPESNILLTDSEKEVAPIIENATGKRKAYSLTDLQRMRAMFKRKMRAWSEGNMYALLTEEAITQIFPANDPITATYMQATSEAERREGVILKVQGWKIMTRGSVYLMKNDKSFKDFGAVAEATDTEGCLFWNKNLVEKAIGTTEAFERIGDPQWYGDIYSFLVRVGGRAKRKDYAGVGVLMQANA